MFRYRHFGWHLTTIAFFFFLMVTSNVRSCQAVSGMSNDNNKILGSAIMKKSVIDSMYEHATLIIPYLRRIICQLNTVKTLHIYYEEDVHIKNDVVMDINQHCMMPLIIDRINSTKSPSTNFGSKRFILVNLQSLIQNYSSFLPFLKKTMPEKHNIRIIFLIESTMKGRHELRPLFEEIWKRQFLNVIALYRNQDIRILTFNPFFNNFAQEITKEDLTKDDVFYDKTKDLNGFPLNVSLFAEDARVIFTNDYKLSGTDALVSKMIEKRMNAMFMYGNRFDGFGEFLANGTPTESLAKLINGEVEMSFNLRIHRLGFIGMVEVTVASERSDLCVIVPYVNNRSQFGNLFKGFDFFVWICMVIMFFVTACLWMITSIIAGDRESSFLDVLLIILGIKLGQPMTVIPRKGAVKFLVIFFILYALLITNAFKSTLIVKLLQPNNGTQIDTATQLSRTKFPLLVYDRYRSFVEENLGNPGYDQIKSRLLTVNASVYAAHLANNSKVGFINKKHLTAFYVNEKRHLDHGIPVYHEMKECAVPILQTYATALGTPYLGRVNLLLRHAQEAGLFVFWQSYLKDQIGTSREGKSSITTDSEERVPLGMQHVQAAFSLLALGLFISFVVFGLEVVVHSMKN